MKIEKGEESMTKKRIKGEIRGVEGRLASKGDWGGVA